MTPACVVGHYVILILRGPGFREDWLMPVRTFPSFYFDLPSLHNHTGDTDIACRIGAAANLHVNILHGEHSVTAFRQSAAHTELRVALNDGIGDAKVVARLPVD